jgi:hypothetical protein
MIEKYITEVYEPECERSKMLMEERGEGSWLSEVKREFNEYCEGKAVMCNGGRSSEGNSKTSNDFQTLIRTRQLFN